MNTTSKMTQRWSEYNLATSERPRKVYEYYASGQGQFPYDMLRYDGCWPADADAAFKLDQKVLRSVRLRSYREPTIGRWTSFLWSVGQEKL